MYSNLERFEIRDKKTDLFLTNFQLSEVRVKNQLTIALLSTYF